MAEEKKNKSKNHFACTTENEKEKLFDDRVKKNTQRATKNAMSTLSEYLKEKNLKEFSELRDDELPDILLDFYTNLRKVDGGHYKLQTLKCLRAGINRFTKEKRNLDIIKDTKFTRTNEMFKAVTTLARKQGLGSTKSYPPIEESDMSLLAQFFDHDYMNNPDPRRIQKCLIFYIIYFFCRRGRENLYEMTKETFKIATEYDGVQYIYQAVGEMDKNHGADNIEPANKGRMYEQPDSRLCPVAIFKLYISKLNPNVNFLWQRPKNGHIYYTDEVWYDKVRVGHDPLERYMHFVGQEIGLSKPYTNHSIRSTVMGILGDEYEGREVIFWSGHSSENTIKQYVKNIPEKKKREMCGSLANSILPKIPKVAHIDANNIQNQQQMQPLIQPQVPHVVPVPDIIEPNEPNFDLQFDLEEYDDAPSDDVLNNFLDNFENHMQNAPAVHPNVQANTNPNAVAINVAQPPANPLQNVPPAIQNQQYNLPNMNIQNIQNNPNPFMPAMYFPGSNVTINYNFRK